MSYVDYRYPEDAKVANPTIADRMMMGKGVTMSGRGGHPVSRNILFSFSNSFSASAWARKGLAWSG